MLTDLESQKLVKLRENARNSKRIEIIADIVVLIAMIVGITYKIIK